MFWVDCFFLIYAALVACAVLASFPAWAASCQPVRKYSYTLASDVALSCSPNSVTVFRISVPDRGRFLARANLRVRGTGTVPELVHGWSARWSSLGDPGFSSKIGYAAGEDLCAGETRSKDMLGYGKLDAANHSVSLAVHAYRSTNCENKAVTIGAGSSLDLWVEDSSPSCEGRDIAAFSYFNRQAAKHGDEDSHPVSIGASPGSIIQGSIELTAPARSLQIIGQTEMSPASTQNTCGWRYNSGLAWLHVNGSSVAGGYRADTYPPSDGMTHLLLTPSVAVTPAAPGLYRFGIAASVSQIEQQPVPVGTHISGDSIVAAIALRDAPRSPAPRDRKAAPVARENHGIRGARLGSAGSGSSRPGSPRNAATPTSPQSRDGAG